MNLFFKPKSLLRVPSSRAVQLLFVFFGWDWRGHLRKGQKQGYRAGPGMLVEVYAGWPLSEPARGLSGPHWALKEDFC